MDDVRAASRNFRLLDFVVVCAIVAVVTGLLLPAVVKVRGGNDAVALCQDNLHNIGYGLHNYSESRQDALPPILDYLPGKNECGWMPFWFTLMPDLEQTSLFNRARGTGAGWGAGNHAAVVKVLLCPSDSSSSNGICTSGATGWAGTSYAPNYFVFGTQDVFDPTKGVNITQSRYTMATLMQGKAHTVSIVERFACFPKYGWSNATLYPMSHSYWGFNAYGSAYGAWGALPPQTRARSSGENVANPHHPNTYHSACQVLFLDGSIRPITGTITPNLWEHLCMPDRTPVPGEDWLWR